MVFSRYAPGLNWMGLDPKDFFIPLGQVWWIFINQSKTGHLLMFKGVDWGFQINWGGYL